VKEPEQKLPEPAKPGENVTPAREERVNPTRVDPSTPPPNPKGDWKTTVAPYAIKIASALVGFSALCWAYSYLSGPRDFASEKIVRDDKIEEINDQLDEIGVTPENVDDWEKMQQLAVEKAKLRIEEEAAEAAEIQEKVNAGLIEPPKPTEPATRWSADGTPGFKKCQIVRPDGKMMNDVCSFGNDVNNIPGILYGKSLAPTKGTVNGVDFEVSETEGVAWSPNGDDGAHNRGVHNPVTHRYFFPTASKEILCELEVKKTDVEGDETMIDQRDVSNIIRCGTLREWSAEFDQDTISGGKFYRSKRSHELER